MADLDLAALRAELTRDEGVRLHPYLDSVGKTTIGVGRNLTDVGLSLDEVTALLTNDINRATHDLDSALPWWRHLDGVRQRAMVNWAFNVGIGSLLGFKHTLMAMESGDWPTAVAGLKSSLWHRQVGARAERLENMFLKGDQET